MPTEQRGTAYHEAGHAVVAYDAGRRVRLVSIVPDADSSGRCTYDDVLELSVDDLLRPTPRQEIDARDRIVSMLAGSLAEERIHGELTPEINIGATDDYKKAVHLAALMLDDDAEMAPYLEWLTVRATHAVRRWLASDRSSRCRAARAPRGRGGVSLNE